MFYYLLLSEKKTVITKREKTSIQDGKEWFKATNVKNNRRYKNPSGEKMYQEDKGKHYRTETEEQVLWGMRLVKIAFIMLIIGFVFYIIESIIEINWGLKYLLIDPIFSLSINSQVYVVANIFLTIYTVAFSAAIFTLGFGNLFLSRLMLDPVKKELKITGILFLTLVPIDLIGKIIQYSLYSNYSPHTALNLGRSWYYTQFAFNALKLLFLVIIAMKMGKELRRLNEMQHGKNGTIVFPGVLLAFFIIWFIGGIVYYVVYSLEVSPLQIEPVITAAIYVEGIAQILYAATAVGTFIALLLKANKIAISPLAAMNKSYY